MDDKLKKVDPEPISSKEQQAEKKELMEAARKAAKGGSKGKDELDDVETISKEQAEKEIRQAAEKIKNQKKSK